MMSKKVLPIILLAFIYINAKEIGVGIIVGVPTGLSVKYWMSEKEALVGLANWYYSEKESKIYFGVDYLTHNYKTIKSEELTGKTPFYYGIGVRILSTQNVDKESDVSLGARFPIGIEYLFKDIPFDLFFEFAPGVYIFKNFSLDLNFGIGIRYTFKLR